MELIQSGPRDAKIVIVGEAPGSTEARTKFPFSGGSGTILDQMLTNVGLMRPDIFVTNVAHVQPPKNDFRWFFKPKVRPEYIAGVIQLKKDLEEIKPNIVVAMGGQSLKVLTGKDGISKWRGSILESTLVHGLKVVGTYHPAYIMRIWDYKAVAEFDLQRVAKQAKFPEIKRPQRDLVLNPSEAEAITLADDMQKGDLLSVDIECFETPTGWKLACVGFSDRADRALVLPCDYHWQIELIRRLCTSDQPKVFQNGTFDITVLMDNGIEVPYTSFKHDTMLGHHALFNECASGGDEMSILGGKKKQAAIQKGLAFQASVYTEEPFYKDDGKLWKETGDLEMFWRYNALDAAVTREIANVQFKEIADFGVQPVIEHEMALVEPLHKMMLRGVKINMELRAELRKKYEGQVANLQQFLDQAAGGSLNVKSPKQMQTFLYDKLGLPIKRHKDTKNPSANKDAIIELAAKYNNPLLHTVLEIRQRRDFIERYLTAKVDKDDRMRCQYDITGTRFGRLSSRQSIYGSGTNLQNIPHRRPDGEAIRRMFEADEGKVLIGRDYSQAEAWLVAYLARCDTLIELLNDPNRDVHTENASRIFERKTIKLISDGGDVSDDERYLAKRVIHASNYGMSEFRLVQVVNEDSRYTGVSIDLRQARMLIEKYFLMYPEIKEVFWFNVMQDLRRSRVLTTPFGRKLTFFGRWDDNLKRAAYSAIPQSTVGDLGCKAVVNCYHNIEKVVPGAELLLQVHDAVYMQCWEKDVEQVATLMGESMKIPITLDGRTFVIPTDCKVGKNWGARPKKNPEENPHGMINLDKWLKEAA